MKIRPLGDRILVKREEEESQTASGIYIPETAKEKPQRARVIAIGEGRLLDNGQRASFQVKEGDTVLLSKWGGTEVDVDGKDGDDAEHLILSEGDILGVVES